MFYEWYRQILRITNYPFYLINGVSVFRAEKIPALFSFRNTEFLWQEGHTLHASENQARQFALNIWKDYQIYAEKKLWVLDRKKNVRPKTEGEEL